MPLSTTATVTPAPLRSYCCQAVAAPLSPTVNSSSFCTGTSAERWATKGRAASLLRLRAGTRASTDCTMGRRRVMSTCRVWSWASWPGVRGLFRRRMTRVQPVWTRLRVRNRSPFRERASAWAEGVADAARPAARVREARAVADTALRRRRRALAGACSEQVPRDRAVIVFPFVAGCNLPLCILHGGLEFDRSHTIYNTKRQTSSCLTFAEKLFFRSENYDEWFRRVTSHSFCVFN